MNDETVAMGRLVGDGIYFLVVDVVVKPEFQGMGIGSKIIDMLLAYVDRATPVGGRSGVQLIERFGKDSIIALATTVDGTPYVRNVNAFYSDGVSYVLTYGLSNKMKQIHGTRYEIDFSR